MASPYTAYFAGMGTVVAALAIGFSTAVMLTSPLPEQKEQPTGFEKRAAKPEKPAEPAAPPVAERRLDAPVSPLITAIQTPSISTTSTVPSAPQPPATSQSTTQSAAQEPGMLQPPVRPAAPVQAAAPTSTQPTSTQVTPPAQTVAPVAAPPPEQVIAPQPARPAARSREVVRNPDMTGSIDSVTGQWKKKEKRDYAQKKQRRPIEQARPAPQIEEEEVVETRSTTGSGYARERAPAPLGIFNLLLGTGH